MPHHFILVRPTGSITGGTVIEYTGEDVAHVYTAAERDRLARGQRVARDGVDHLDLVASVVASEIEVQALATDIGALT